MNPLDIIRIGLAGPRLVENAMLTVGPFEDWSGVRSPSRARRRRRLGHRQRIRFFYEPDPKLYRTADMIVAHPVTMQKFRDAMRQAEAFR